MGQGSSRHHDQASIPPSSSDLSTATTPAVAGTSTYREVRPEIYHASASHRPSIRKNILKYVKRRSRRLSRFASNPAEPRRSNPNFQRLPSGLDNPLQLGECENIDAGPSNFLSSSTPTSDKGKGRERVPFPVGEQDYREDGDEMDETSQATSLNINQGNIDTAPTFIDALHEENASLLDLQSSSSDFDDSVPIPIYDWESQETVSPRPHQPSTIPIPLPISPPRQFPPPGALVVVQGIVHTTDVSRPNTIAASNPSPRVDPPPDFRSTHRTEPVAEQSSSRTRNRLSTLLRPRSTSSPLSSPPNEHTPGTFVSEPDSPPNPLLVDSHVISEDLNRTNVLVNGHSTQSESVPSISSSSIDVLGSLLSVAAAATAASLFSGSSEPILSSGLAHPASFPPSQAATASQSASALPNLPAASSSIPVINPDLGAAGRADRMRHVLGTILERIGLRPPLPSPNAVSVPQENGDSGNRLPDHDSSSPAERRELMLAEMARAFNIGLGLGGLEPTTSDPQANENATDIGDGTQRAFPPPESEHSVPLQDPSSNATLPPSGSFERFLVDLRIDLRTALTRNGDENEIWQNMDAPSLQSSPYIPGPSLGGASSLSAESILQVPITEVAHSDQDSNNNVNTSQITEDLYADMPSLREVSDSDSDFDESDLSDGDYDGYDDPGRSGLNNVPFSPSREAGHVDSSGRINRWWFYRFPPIVPRVDMVVAGLSHPVAPVASSAAASSLSSMASSYANHSEPIRNYAGPSSYLDSGSSFANSPVHQETARSPSSSSREGPSDRVVPVIVVGVQSVNQDWRPEVSLQGENDGVDVFEQPDINVDVSPEESAENVNLNDSDSHDQIPLAPGANLEGTQGGRGMGWHSRAANAIRNMRPRRRNVETGGTPPTPAASNGSRTFLIYVIGGYYPPDHSIVTGGPNVLDSFLAELLGQVKPPTASKDDIEKSGLEIIKAAELAQREKDGRVSSNCTDRCLICLDDYEREDSVRVMSCRHAFHRACVDEWLQKGRNNCPACRSTGVKVEL